MRARWVHFRFTLFSALDVSDFLDLPLRVEAADCEPFGPIIDHLLLVEPGAAETLGGVAKRHAAAWHLLDRLTDVAPLRADASALLRQKDRLVPALDYMETHLADKVVVEYLADIVHMSVPHFHAFFRRCMGRSPMTHLKRLRLAGAARLLLRDNAPLEEVAGATGFCNAYHLSREFRRYFGKPPGTWRKEHDRTMA